MPSHITSLNFSSALIIIHTAWLSHNVIIQKKKVQQVSLLPSCHPLDILGCHFFANYYTSVNMCQRHLSLLQVSWCQRLHHLYDISCVDITPVSWYHMLIAISVSRVTTKTHHILYHCQGINSYITVSGCHLS